MIRLAYDEGEGVGMGHRRRMEALAAALRALGHEPALGALDGDLAGDVVVVDSYRARADDGGVRAGSVVAVDDLERDLAVDVVVDPAPGAPHHPMAGRVLVGLEHALLDPALTGRVVAPVGEAVDTVLVTAGAADGAGVGAAVAAGVRTGLPGADVRLVVGPWSSGDVPEGVEAVRADSGLADELAGADLVVTASGVTLLEALALGRPTVAFVTAGNQRRYHDGLVAAGAVVGAATGEAARAAVALAGEAGHRRRRLAAAGRELVDGWGAARVAQAVAALA